MATQELSLDTVRKQVEAFKPKVKELRSMAELELVTPYSAKIGQKTIGLDKTAVRGLCHELGMPKGFFSKLYSKNKQAWGTLTRALQEGHRKPLVLVAAKDRVIAIVGALSDITKHKEVLNTAETVLRAYPTLKLTHVDFNGVNLNLNLLIQKPFDPGQWLGNIDLFRFGVVMTNSIIDGFEIQSCIERAMCTNLMYFSSVDGTERNVYDLEKVPDFVDSLIHSGLDDEIKRRVLISRKIHASLGEVLEVDSLFDHRADKARPFLQAYANQLRIGEIAWAYNMTAEDIQQKPSLWRSTVKTPFVLYDLLNWFTYIARHDPRLSQDEINTFRIKSGRMLFDSPDLASVAEERIISKKPWMLSPN